MIEATIASSSGWSAQLGDELPVDLELVDRQPAQLPRLGEPGPEVVDGDPHPALAQLPDHERASAGS